MTTRRSAANLEIRAGIFLLIFGIVLTVSGIVVRATLGTPRTEVVSETEETEASFGNAPKTTGDDGTRPTDGFNVLAGILLATGIAAFCCGISGIIKERSRRAERKVREERASSNGNVRLY